MIYQNIDKMQNAEAVKDEFFKNTIGFGRSEDTTHEESFMACQTFRDTYKQPAIFDISNNRPTTDSLYVPDQSKWDNDQTYAIDQMKSKYTFVEVTDKEAFEVRAASFNVLSQGDAALEVLHTKLIKHWQNISDGSGTYEEPEIIDAAYCAVGKTTLYFFKAVL